jgi:hypothetical protein
VSRLERAFARLGLESAPSTEEWLRSEESATGAAIPASLRELFRVAAGFEHCGRPSFVVFRVGTVVDVLGQFATDGQSDELRGLVPFADDSGPRFFAVDGDGAVVSIGRGGGSIRRVASDVASFIEDIADRADAERDEGEDA